MAPHERAWVLDDGPVVRSTRASRRRCTPRCCLLRGHSERASPRAAIATITALDGAAFEAWRRQATGRAPGHSRVLRRCRRHVPGADRAPVQVAARARPATRHLTVRGRGRVTGQIRSAIEQGLPHALRTCHQPSTDSPRAPTTSHRQRPATKLDDSATNIRANPHDSHSDSHNPGTQDAEKEVRKGWQG
jgi:hypothetical protein